MANRFTLGKNEKLKSRKDIEQLFSQGKKLSENPLIFFYQLNESKENFLKMGVGISSRSFKKAVDRNKIKRLIREAWRMQKNDLHNSLAKKNQQANIFIIYTGKEMPPYQEIAHAIKNTLVKLDKIIQKEN